MKLTEKQLEQIRAQIKRVKEFGNPFYTKRFANVNPEDIKTQEDFENLVPFVTKQELRDAYPLGLATVPEEEIVRIHSSSVSINRVKSSFFNTCSGTYLPIPKMLMPIKKLLRINKIMKIQL